MKNCFKLFKNIGLATLVAFGACSNAAKILDEEQTWYGVFLRGGIGI